MNDQDRGILVGMVMGDGYLGVRMRGKAYESSELTVVHSVVQRDYVAYKAELVRKIFGGVFTVREKSTTLKNGKKYFLCGFSKSHKYFSTLKHMMYRDRKKVVTDQVLGMLTVPGIAIWYMDDGHARRNLNKEGFVSSVSTQISTCCSEPEASRICEWLAVRHGVQFRPFPEGPGFSVRCNTGESHKFARLVEPYIIPSMRYKLAHVADLNLHERQAPIGKCSTCGNVIYDNRRKGMCDACYMQQYKRR